MHKCNRRDLTAHNSGVILAMVVVVGGPLALAMSWLLRVTDSAFPALLARFAVGSDLLTAGAFGADCLLLGIAMMIGNRFLTLCLKSSRSKT